jgi:hypothetical protein
MWLRYGIDANNTLIAIEDTRSGKTNLECPYCGSRLTAKKGIVKEHHFAHNDGTCRIVIQREPRELPNLPLYDAFDIFLTGKELEQLKKLWHRHKSHNNGIHSLEVLPAFTRENLVKHNQHLNVCNGSGTYEFTDLGKIPVKALPLSRFNFVQEPLIVQKLTDLESAIFNSQGIVLPEPELSFRLTDLRIYSAQLRKILLSTLYYLEVQADGQMLYKIGVTTRPISKRLAEVYRDMRSHFQTVAINVLGTWSSRGNIEKYFKYRYSHFNYPIGSLTEYFKFVDPDDAQAVQRDLHQMKPKVLSQVEQDIVEGKPNLIEQVLYTQTKPLERSHYSELDRVFLSSPSSRKVIEAFYQGYSLNQAAEIAAVPVNTARKVLAVLQKQQMLS